METFLQLKSSFEEQVAKCNVEAMEKVEDELRNMLKLIENMKKNNDTVDQVGGLTLAVEELRLKDTTETEKKIHALDFPDDVKNQKMKQHSVTTEKQHPMVTPGKPSAARFHYERVAVWYDFFTSSDSDMEDVITRHSLTRDTFFRGRQLKAVITSLVARALKMPPSHIEFMEEYMNKLKNAYTDEGYECLKNFLKNAPAMDSEKGPMWSFLDSVSSQLKNWAKEGSKRGPSRNHFPLNNSSVMEELRGLRSPEIQPEFTCLLLGSAIGVARAATHARLGGGTLHFNPQHEYIGSRYAKQRGDLQEAKKKLEELGRIETIIEAEIM